MVDRGQFESVVAGVAAWAVARPDIVGVAVVGSWARKAARLDSDIDLCLITPNPEKFRHACGWLTELCLPGWRVANWCDADYGAAWSRHVELEPPCEIEFTFCTPAWAATDPVDLGTAGVLAGGCRILVDKARLFANLLGSTIS